MNARALLSLRFWPNHLGDGYSAFQPPRKRLIPYDSASPSPHLGRYGAGDGREYQQYFLHDDNNAGGGCPFAKLAQNKPLQIEGKEQAA